MKKYIILFLILAFLSPNLLLAQIFEDDLANKLDKNLKIKKEKYVPIEDELVKVLNSKLKVQKYSPVFYDDELVLKTLDSSLKIEKSRKILIEDNLANKIDKTKIPSNIKKVVDFKFDGGKIKVSSRKYHSTRRKLYEGEYIDFVLVEDAKIENKTYQKGTIIKARVETLSKNGAYGVPADLVIGSFTMPDNVVLNGQITKQGANRSLWVYPTGYLLTPILFIGLPIFAIRGGHVKLRPSKVYEIDI